MNEELAFREETRNKIRRIKEYMDRALKALNGCDWYNAATDQFLEEDLDRAVSSASSFACRTELLEEREFEDRARRGI